MEFRIAPLIMAFFNLIFITLVNPFINESVALSSVSNIWKIVIPFIVIFFMALGSFARHSYYSKFFKATFFMVQVLNVGLLVYFVYTIKSQHL